MDDSNKTRKNIEMYHGSVAMPGGWDFSITDTLQQVDAYYNGKFLDGDVDEKGLKRYFYNIIKPACDIASKFIDLDTKNVLLYSKPGTTGGDFKVWVMQRGLLQWMKENEFGVLINKIKNLLPKYGHIVLKRGNDNVWDRVNIQNLRMNPSVSLLKESHFVYEIHDMTPRQIRQMPWDKEAVEELLQDNEEPSLQIWECYDMSMDPGENQWTRTFQANLFSARKGDGLVRASEANIGEYDDFVPGVILHTDSMDELPYREHKFEEVEGRWLGMGWSEYLLDNQMRQNEISNSKARNMMLSSIQLFKTNDDAIGRNVLTDLDNGDIIQTDGDITQVDMRTRAMPEYNVEEQRWDLNTERKTFSFDITRGESLPSGTPLGVARLSAGMVETFYGGKREELGLFLKKFIVDDVLPSFKKDKRKEHVLKFFTSDSDIQKLRSAIVEHQMRKAIMDYAAKSGTLPSPLAVDLEKMRLEGSLKKRKDVELKIPKGFYDDAEASVDVTIVGEEIDVSSRMQSMTVALQTLSGNPNIVKDPATRTAFFKMLELAGMSAADLGLMEEAAEASQSDLMAMLAGQAQPQPAGGRVSIPKPPTSPVQPVTGEASVTPA